MRSFDPGALIDNINSTEGWTSAKVHPQHEQLGKRSSKERAQAIIESIAAEAGTTIEEIVDLRQQIFSMERWVKVMKTDYL